MKTMSKIGLMILSAVLVLSLGLTALAEGTPDAAPEAPSAAAAADDAQAKADALNEALTAYSNAKADSRKQTYLDNLKQELDSYVAAGKLTREQADLIYEYYAEQMTLQQNNGMDFRRGGKGGRNGQNSRGADQNGSGRSGRNGRFGSTTVPDQTAPSAQNAPDGT